MATKPSAIVEWNTAGTNRTTPTGGQISTGIAAGEVANSSRMNYLLNLLGLWTAYLNDGAFTGAHTFGSTVGVTGLITATAGLTAAANAHVTVSGTGRFKFGDTVSDIQGVDFVTGGGSSGAILYDISTGYATTASGFYHSKVRLPVGARFRSAVLSITADANAATRTFRLRRTLRSTNVTTTVATTNSTATSSTYDLTLSAVDHVIEAGYNYVLEFSNSGGAADVIKGGPLTHDQP